MKTKSRDTALLVALQLPDQEEFQIKEYLDELEFLAETLGYESLKKFKQKLAHPDPRSFIGKGKLEEIISFAKASEADALIFDDDLTPSQIRNIEKDSKIKVYDRSLLILDIFLKRAQTSQAKIQVELARYQYLLPRLTRMWTHLERQRGGTGTRGGAGEREIETDRRNIRNQINILKAKLDKIEKQGFTQRKGREGIVRVALVGYTNVGKSTLMRKLSKADVYAENKLFATVDATVRKVVFNRIPFLLSDTVGFIRKLPHHLIESFKSTLEEVREADILLHVADVSHPAVEEHIAVVNHTLKDLGAVNKSVILVFNKVDLLPSDPEEKEAILYKLRSHYKNEVSDIVFVSAEENINFEELRELIFKRVKKKHLKIYPHFLKDEIY
ncbi:MAG: GTPase HflX [Candidatus Cyclobacteriaceae bacterium M2_1C_046]